MNPLRNIDQSYLSMLNQIPGGVSIATDRSCKKILHNDRAAAFFGVRFGENFSLSAESPPDFTVYKDGRKLNIDELPAQRSAWYGDTVIGEVFEGVWGDGTRKFAVFNSKPLLGEYGEIVGALVTFEEITSFVLRERESNNKQLAMRTELERLDRLDHVAKLTAGISHEIRNPLTIVRGFLQLMRSKENYSADPSMLQMMIDELDRANGIISDFLSLTSKNHDFRRGSLIAVLGKVIPLLEADAFINGKKVALRANEVADIEMDPKAIQQVVLNLVKNALEATPKGGTVYVETFETNADAGFLVIDEGGGIPKTVLDNIGKPFLTTKENGTGVGLSICYDIIARHRGSIDVGSSSKGTVFQIQFPKAGN